MEPGTRVKTKVPFYDFFHEPSITLPPGKMGTVKPSQAVKGRWIVHFDDGSWANYEPEWFEVVELKAETDEY